ncbi:MAG: sensor histidine kinase [Candidatus Omnitrophota bacterium]|nr:sensor histidine kinase [Candidatus Omnitrophota bacterium]
MIESRTTRKVGIRYKVILIVCFSTMIVMSMGIILGYIFGFNVLQGMVGDIHRKFSQLLADDLTRKFEEELERIKRYAVVPADAAAGNALKAVINADTNIAGAAVIDKPDSLMKKSIHVGDVEFDGALKEWVIPVYVPIRNSDGTVMSVFRAGLSVKNFFSFIGKFRIDNTGHAIVIDGMGNIIFHPGSSQTGVKLCADRDYQRLLTSKNRYASIYEPNVHKRSVFAAFSEVAPPALSSSRKVWRVVVEEDAKEVFAPLGRIAPWLVTAVIFLFIAVVVIGFVFSGVLVKPIEALYAAVTEIGKGNWNYKIDIRTGDEIEQFADAFKKMISSVKGKTEELLKAKFELEDLSNSLEEKVLTRTIDLTMAKDKIDNYARELEKAIMVKSDFVSMASHELRTPLAAIKEGIDIVLAGKTGAVNNQQREFLDMAKRNLDRLSRLINDVLDFQKLENGKATMKIRDNDINDAVKEVCQTMEHLTKEKNLELATDLAADIPKAEFDRDRIIQVLMNLIGNAVKFTHEGSIKVKTSKEGDIVKVSIRDTGIGVKEEDMPQLFKKFTQIEKGLERRSGGTGLGLTISKEIIEKHGGKIWADSKPGEGTVFYFTLPLEEARNYS